MCFFFFFKQKTAYEMRISDWSSDVCSSDLLFDRRLRRGRLFLGPLAFRAAWLGRCLRISGRLQAHDRDAFIPIVRRFSQAKGEEQEQQAAGDEQGQAYGKRASPGADAENFGIMSGRNGDQLKPSVAATADRGARRRHPRGIGGCRTDDKGEDRSKRELAGPAPLARFRPPRPLSAS